MKLPKAATLLALGLALVLPGWSQQKAGPKHRTIYLAAVEAKGGANVAQEPFPSKAPVAGGGYILKKPDDKGRWEISSYRWDPGTMVVNEGDTVTLEIVGINGDEHPFTIEGYWLTGTVRRGEVTRMTFKADKAGIFKFICRKHAPSMQADFVVLAGKPGG